MTPEIAITLGIIGLAVVIFATEKLRVDLVALLVLLAVGLTGLIEEEQIFLGFANSAVITVWAVYIVSGGLFRTGVADRMGKLILRLAGESEARLVGVIMLTCGTMSAFMNNVGATAMLLPAVVGISRRTGIAVSRLLIPLSFSSLMGGNVTLIGTPANILATNILRDRGLADFAFFDFAPTGLVVFAVGIAYMVLVGRHLLPERPTTQDRARDRLQHYVSEVKVLGGSALVDRTLMDSRLGADYDLSVLGILRVEEILAAPRADTRIEAGDVLIVEGDFERMREAAGALGLRLVEDRHPNLEAMLGPEEAQVFEAILAPESRMVGQSLVEARFRDRYGFSVLAIRRRGELLTQRLRDLRLQLGDALLLQGSHERLPALQVGDDFLVLEPVEIETYRRDKAPIAIGAMALVLALVLVPAVGLHISTAMVIGAVVMVLSGCLSMDEAYESIDWKTVFLVAGMLPLGLAMEETGTAQFLADGMLRIVGDDPMLVLAGIYLFSALITQPMSNAAAVVLVVPIAVDAAAQLGFDHLPLVLAAVIGASTSFITPVGHKANVLVFGPGGYRFFDYTKVGLGLTLALMVATLLVLPVFWPLVP